MTAIQFVAAFIASLLAAQLLKELERLANGLEHAPGEREADPEPGAHQPGFHAGRWPGTGSAEPGASRGRVSVFTREGKLLSRWGDHLFAPHGIWADSRGGLYVAEVALSAGGPPASPTLQKFVPVTA